MSPKLRQLGKDMHDFARVLWPLCRSLTGPGTMETLNILRNRHPLMQFHSFWTGEKVFDWEIPKVWTIRDAFIEHESGQRFAEFSKLNLSVLGYSAPLDITVQRNELDPYLHTEPNQPDRVPYVTSYYNERSGFCLSETEKQGLPEGSYRLFVDSDLEDGELVIAECLLEGKSTEEILVSTYICHPSMANNELSGPVVADQLLQDLRERQQKQGLRYSYRILFLVETIGSIAYLSRFAEHLKANVQAGFVLSCVGDERAYSHVESRHGNTLADRALAASLIGKPNKTRYSFLSRGSDERQFCSPGIDLPVCGFCRSKYGTYPEYHTDADTLELVTPTGLADAYAVLAEIVSAFENGLYPMVQTACEPQLGKRGLYPTISQKGSYDAVRLRMNVLAYADGKTDVFDICNKIGTPLDLVNAELQLLSENGLVHFEG